MGVYSTDEAIRIPPLSETQRAELETLYRKTQLPRLRSRAQMVLLAAEQGLSAPVIATIVLESDDTVGRWLKRYLAEGIEGLQGEPRSGRPSKVSDSYRQTLVKAVRRRPRSLDLPFSLWSLQRLADYMAEQTGVRVVMQTVRRQLQTEGIVLSRP